MISKIKSKIIDALFILEEAFKPGHLCLSSMVRRLSYLYSQSFGVESEVLEYHMLYDISEKVNLKEISEKTLLLLKWEWLSQNWPETESFPVGFDRQYLTLFNFIFVRDRNEKIS